MSGVAGAGSCLRKRACAKTRVEAEVAVNPSRAEFGNRHRRAERRALVGGLTHAQFARCYRRIVPEDVDGVILTDRHLGTLAAVCQLEAAVWSPRLPIVARSRERHASACGEVAPKHVDVAEAIASGVINSNPLLVLLA